MPVSVKVDPINRDIDLLLDESFSPKAQAAAFAEYAADQIEQAKETDRSVLGRTPSYTVAVDGRLGAPLESVKPNGVIVAEFDVVTDVLAWIADQLVTHSPVGDGRDRHSGLYQKSHTLFADGVEVDVGGVVPPAREFVFLNTAIYARKIEKGSSSQAPDGVYQAVAVLGSRRFGNVAKISFAYRTPFSGALVGGHAGNRSEGRQPAIIVKLGDR